MPGGNAFLIPLGNGTSVFEILSFYFLLVRGGFIVCALKTNNCLVSVCGRVGVCERGYCPVGNSTTLALVGYIHYSTLLGAFLDYG